ncbi:MAG: cell division protein ZapA [Bacillota bacterium]
MPDDRNRVAVTIYGEEYTLKSSASQEYVLKLAELVDRKMREVGEANPKLGISRVAVMAALRLADDLLRLRDEMEQVSASLEEEWMRRHRST